MRVAVGGPDGRNSGEGDGRSPRPWADCRGARVGLLFRLLGAVGVADDRGPVVIKHARVRSVLAALLVDVNKAVSTETLVDRVWGEDLPKQPRDALYSYVSRLRSALTTVTGAALVQRPGGYLLQTDADAVDLHRFRGLVARAAAGDDAHRVEVLADALELWTGTPLEGLTGPWPTSTREVLEAELLTVRLDHFDARLRLGGHADCVGPLGALAAERPSDERVLRALLTALVGCGRRHEALTRYAELRHRLADELGVDPGPELQRLHQEILAADGPVAPTPKAVPRQLPAPPRHFLARDRELAVLTRALGDGGAVVISAIGGGGGIGKTTLAVHWAHRNLHRFPDGQLYVNLRGFDPDSEPTPPSAALRGFLGALGVPPGSVPPDLDGQSALYRSALADKRMLVVLDNAADTAQVAPLLAGGTTCLTLVTSRSPLTGLVAVHGALPVPLAVLSDHESRALLARHLGEARMAAEPDAVDDVVRHCAGLPLALGIVAARATTRPDLGLAAQAAALRDHRTRLDALDTGDADLNLRAVLSWSRRALTPAAARLFDLLGLTPGPDVSTAAAAALLAADPTEPLAELEANHLVTQPEPGRYRMHDLVRLYAAERSNHDDPALRRIVDFYLHTAHAADRLLDPLRPALTLTSTPEDAAPLTHRDATEALAWLTTEYPCLLGAQRLATAQGRHARVWELASVLDTYHWRQGHTANHVAVLNAAVAAAEADGDAAVQARLHRNLGQVHTRLGAHEHAMTHLERSLAAVRRTDDPLGEAHAHSTLARTWGQGGDLHRAKVHATTALNLYRATTERTWEADALNQLGYIAALLGEHDEALARCQAALTLNRELGREIAQAEALDSIGQIHENTGHLTEALDCYRSAITLFDRHAHNHDLAGTLDHLARVHLALGDSTGARQAWDRALPLYRTQNRTEDAERVRTTLANLTTTPSLTPTA